MAPLQFSLPSDLQSFVDAQISSGSFGSTTEVVHEALRVFREYQEARARQKEQLRADIQAGLDELDRGEGETLDIAKLKRELHMRLQQAE